MIEAEDFDSGGENFSYHDTDELNIAGDYRTDVGVDIYDRLGDGYHIGNALPGEWYEYSVDVAAVDTYKVVVHTAAPMQGGTFQIRVGDILSPVMTAPNSYSWLTTDTVSVLMILEAGEQIMRFSALSDPLFNIDKIEFMDPHAEPEDSTTFQNNPRESTWMNAFQGPGDQLVIQCGQPVPVSIQIFDISGRMLYSRSDMPATFSIPQSLLCKGICIIQAQAGKKQIRKKVFLH